MTEENIYMTLWQKYRPVILAKMQQALESPCQYKLFKHEFEAIGEKKRVSYGFNLMLEKGAVANNIKSSAIARDLFEVLKSSETANRLMQTNNFKINMTKDFMLNVQMYE